MQGDSYCNFDLPLYFGFNTLLEKTTNALSGKTVNEFQERPPRNFNGVNHVILNNKDGLYAWRPLELIHPALYVSLVNEITAEENWDLILQQFSNFRANPAITCLSLPVKSISADNDKAQFISQWWEDVEQKSIELALDYPLVVKTDIVDCYPAIYTHSIAWALHGKQYSKDHRDCRRLIGNRIDASVREMRYGQTNGIPQGSALMDLIAEMVLGYADTELTEKINKQKITEYRILRFRDDYRIFVMNQQDGERILKSLGEVLIDLGLKLNPLKTDVSGEVIQSSIKDDKIGWLVRRQHDRNLQKRLLIIHDHSLQYPNSGSLQTALERYYRRLEQSTGHERPLPLVSIVVDIAFKNPRTYPIASAILSKLLSFVEDQSVRRSVIEKIKDKFLQLPNTGQMDIWLQRITFPIAPEETFREPLCKLLNDPKQPIWNNDWISSSALKQAVTPTNIVNREILERLGPVMSIEEVELFKRSYT